MCPNCSCHRWYQEVLQKKFTFIIWIFAPLRPFSSSNFFNKNCASKAGSQRRNRAWTRTIKSKLFDQTVKIKTKTSVEKNEKNQFFWKKEKNLEIISKNVWLRLNMQLKQYNLLELCEVGVVYLFERSSPLCHFWTGNKCDKNAKQLWKGVPTNNVQCPSDRDGWPRIDLADVLPGVRFFDVFQLEKVSVSEFIQVWPLVSDTVYYSFNNWRYCVCNISWANFHL